MCTVKLNIYLDLNFLIEFEKGLCGRWVNDEFAVLYERIDYLVHKGIVQCPITNPIYEEIQKQESIDSKLRIASLLDRWGGGRCLSSLASVMRDEIENILRISSGKEALSIWKKGAFLLDLDENLPNYPAEARSYMRTHLAEMTITQIVRQDKMLREPFKNLIRAHTGVLQEQKKEHESEIKDFKTLRNMEFIASINEQLTHYHDRLETLIKAQTKEFDFSGIREEDMPSVFAFATYQALLRWDRTRKYDDNDFYDIQHCSLALGYFDYLFTERSFYRLTMSSLANLHEKFSLCLAMNAAEALAVLKNL
jgi:hypothetical protein